jgi:uncharacterized protein with GYD domain
MPRYMFTASYTVDGLKGIRAEGGSARLAAVEKLFGSLGGKVEAAYWSFGHTDFICIAELPDNPAAAAAATSVAAAGVASVQTTVLLSADEIDAAVGRSAEYRAPGA